MQELNKQRYASIINQIACQDCNCHYCTLKELLISMHPNPRVLFQFKCIEIYKYDRSEQEQKDIGWEQAANEWVETYAVLFAQAYKEFENNNDLTIIRVYERVMELQEKE